MANPDRLTALDSTFLHLEDHSPAHMHVASVMVFEGEAPTLRELVEHVEGRLHLVPRYRQRLAYVPLGQGRPVWATTLISTLLPHPPHRPSEAGGRRGAEAPGRASVLPAPGSLQAAVGDLARSERGGGRFALIAKTHHALVDGISGVDITTVLFDTAASPPDRALAALERKAAAGPAKLLGEALVERSTIPTR